MLNDFLVLPRSNSSFKIVFVDIYLTQRTVRLYDLGKDPCLDALVMEHVAAGK